LTGGRGRPAVDHVGAEAEATQLITGDHTVLRSRQPSQFGVE
jgi:hypothetical protein